MSQTTSRSAQAIRRLLQESDDSGSWEPCLEQFPIVRGTKTEYKKLVDGLRCVLDEEQWCLVGQKSRDFNTLPRRFKSALGTDEPEVVVVKVADDIVDDLAERVEEFFVKMLSRMETLESLMTPVTKESTEMLAESGKLLKATNLRLDEISSPDTLSTPIIRSTPAASRLRR